MYVIKFTLKKDVFIHFLLIIFIFFWNSIFASYQLKSQTDVLTPNIKTYGLIILVQDSWKHKFISKSFSRLNFGYGISRHDRLIIWLENILHVSDWRSAFDSANINKGSYLTQIIPNRKRNYVSEFIKVYYEIIKGN